MKKFWVVFIMTFVMMSLTTLSYASNEISVYLNDDKMIFDVEPIIINNRTMVPMRKIFENLGATVNWNAETRTVKAEKDTTNLEFTIGSSYMKKNEEQIELDSAPVIYKDRTVVPVRAIAEALDCVVAWNVRERRVDIIAWEKREQKTVKVSNATELLKEIGSNKRIQLTSEFYDLSSLNLDSIANRHIEKSIFSEEGFVIKNVYNLTIEGPARIEISDLYADVLNFENCGVITLKNLTVGHTKPNLADYMCEGSVIHLENCNGILIDNCKLFGCGARGIYADDTIKLECSNTEIYECTYSGISIDGNTRLKAKNVEIYNQRAWAIDVDLFENQVIAEFDNCKIHDITSHCLIFIFDIYNNSKDKVRIDINNSEIYNNVYSDLVDGDNKERVFFNNSNVEKTIREYDNL